MCDSIKHKSTKKKTYKEVKESIESEGYKLLSEEYVNNSTHLLVECPNNHRYEATYGNWKHGRRCAECQHKKKITIEDINKYIEENAKGYSLISTEYINSHEHLKFSCPKGHIFEMTWGNFQQNKRCKFCSKNRKYTKEEVIQFLKDNLNYTLISEYINSKTPISVQCDKGHIYDTTFGMIKRGTKCTICSMENRKLNNDEIREFAESKGFKLIDVFFNKDKRYIEVECKNKHIHKVSWQSFRNKPGCRQCNMHSKEEILDFVNKENFTIDIDNYKNISTDVKFTCSAGHEFVTSFNKFKRNPKCPHCNKQPTFYTTEQLQEIFHTEGYELLSDFTKQKDKVKFKCNKGHIGYIRIDHFLNGTRCDECAKEQRKETMFNNGNHLVYASSQQVYINSLLNGILNFPYNKYLLDIAFPDEKIYLEYNGSGHDMQVKFGNIKKEEFESNEKQRELLLKNSGWKEIKIISSNDKLPSDKIIIYMYNHAKELFKQDNDLVIYDLRKNNIIIGETTKIFNYGTLRKIKKQPKSA